MKRRRTGLCRFCEQPFFLTGGLRIPEHSVKMIFFTWTCSGSDLWPAEKFVW